MKNILYTLLFILAGIPAYCQVGLYTQSPDPSAVVDIKVADKGVLLPRMTTAQKLAIASPAHSLLVYDTELNCVSQNLGSEGAPKWTCLTLANRKFFYMPSINISTATLGAGSIDLYTIYKNQFSTPAYASTGAPASIPSFPSATDLYYYVTYSDPTLITMNGITASGVMSYTTLRKADYDEYINIVFVLK